MDPTIEFLWERKRRRGQPSGTVQSWAIALLTEGIESDAITRMAAERELHWQAEAVLVSQALQDIGQSALENHLDLLRAVEQASVADYLAGKIDGWTLIKRGCDLYYEARGESNEFMDWIGLAEEADQFGQSLRGPSGFHRRSFDEALKSALRQFGRFEVD